MKLPITHFSPDTSPQHQSYYNLQHPSEIRSIQIFPFKVQRPGIAPARRPAQTGLCSQSAVPTSNTILPSLSTFFWSVTSAVQHEVLTEVKSPVMFGQWPTTFRQIAARRIKLHRLR